MAKAGKGDKSWKSAAKGWKRIQEGTRVPGIPYCRLPGLRFHPSPKLLDTIQIDNGVSEIQTRGKSEEQVLVYLSLLQIHRDFLQNKVLNSCQQDWAGGSSGHTFQVSGVRAWSMGLAVWVLAGSPSFGRAHTLHLTWPACHGQGLRGRVGSTK